MGTKTEALLWPAQFSLTQARRLGQYSVELAKSATRKQIETGQSVLRLLDTRELVAFRQEMVESEKEKELKKIIGDLQGRDQNKDDFKGLVGFCTPAILKLIGEWGESGKPVSQVGMAQARNILSEAGVHQEIIDGVLDQLPVERPMDTAELPLPQDAIPSQARVIQPALFNLP